MVGTLSEMTWSWPGDALVQQARERGLDAEHWPLENWPPSKDTARVAHVLRMRRP